MALLRSCNLSKHSPSGSDHISRVHKVALFYSTGAVKIAEDDLYKKILPIEDPNVSILPIIEQWEKEYKPVRFQQLIRIKKSLRKFNRYIHALEVSELMSKRGRRLGSGGVAVHLDLLSRVHGVEQAERYFNSIPDDVKTFQVFGALLNCYAFKTSVKKAEALAEKMRQMGMMNTHSYNVMLTLYKKVGDHEKLDKFYQEMMDMGVPCDKQTYYIRLNAYVSASDLEGMEKLLKNMEENSDLSVDWSAYIIASGGYIKSGLKEKAFEMLQKAERDIDGKSKDEKLKGAAYEILLGRYAVLGKKDDVYRTWDLYKNSSSKVYNRGYISIIGALVTLDDIDGAERLFSEWEAANLSIDFRIPNIFINAYCLKGALEKAESYVGKVLDMGRQPPASTWGFLATAYTREDKMEKAVEMLKKCVAADKRGFNLDQDTFSVCVKYLKEKGDLEVAEDIKRTLEERVVMQQ